MHRFRKDSRSFRIYAEIDTATSHSHSHTHRGRGKLQLQSQLQSQTESPETLKHELLEIHHRYSNDRKRPRRQRRRRRTSWVGDGTDERLLLSNLKDASSYCKDYSKLSKDFVVASRYHLHVCSRKRYPTCVTCKTKRSEKVIFPCEHLCLCTACLGRDGIPTQCPICKSAVHVVFEHTDDAIDRYWLWVDEGKSPLTASFTECFRLKSYGAIDAAIAVTQQRQRRQTEHVEVEHKYCDGNVIFQKQKKKRRSSWISKFLCTKIEV